MTHQTALTYRSDNARYIIPETHETKLRDSGKRARVSKLKKYVEFLDQTGYSWIEPDINAYARWLQDQGKTTSTIQVYCAVVRSRYKTLLRESVVTQLLDEKASEACIANDWEVNPANIAALVERKRRTILESTTLDRETFKAVKKQDRTADEFTRLTAKQVEQFISQTDTKTLIGLRDRALLMLALATGARAAELADLQVSDLRQRTEDNALALQIRQGKGKKQRLIPYGNLSFVVSVVDKWLAAAGITEGPIFRGFWKGGKSVRETALTTMTIERIVGKYPVYIDGKEKSITPHDLRRTYAKLAYNAGMKPVAIQQNLGHAKLETTLGYIGTTDTRDRQPEAFLPASLANV